MKERKLTLVYQGGIANVFQNGSRVYQGDFRTAEAILHGAWLAGAKVFYAFCNKAGDIAHTQWDTPEKHAPFTDSMRIPRAYATLSRA